MEDRDETSRIWFDATQVQVTADPAVREIFDDDALILLSGAPSGSTVTASKTDGGVALHVQNPVLMALVRHLEWRDHGPSIRNHVFQIRPEYRRRGLGARALLVQARAAQQLGFAAIELDATGDYQLAHARHPHDRYLGYCVWPRLGFDADLSPEQARRLSPAWRACKRVSELMVSAEGRDEWHLHGDTLNDAKFDLTPGSVSWRFLLAYSRQRNIRI